MKVANPSANLVRKVKNIARYTIGPGAIGELSSVISLHTVPEPGEVLLFIDEYFRNHPDTLRQATERLSAQTIHVPTSEEPTTDYVDEVVKMVREGQADSPSCLVGIGGGITMDVCKAVANLLTNDGPAEKYQGWDLVQSPAVFKIAIPTISGTGAEASRTCVLTNPRTKLKLGMNSDHTVFDHVIMDPDLTRTVPRDQYFFTGMDAYIHCVESLSGNFRNAIGDAYSRETLSMCRQVFNSDDMMNERCREQLMVASYLGGCAIATSYVGLVHPLSAGLSVVLGLHHCVANCIVMRAMEPFYPTAYREFWEMADRQGVEVPGGVCKDLDAAGFDALHEAVLMHERPLVNALGDGFRDLLTRESSERIFRSM
jgi:3-deoxy-alpha-D-manno-octulosonate 8-oxidase